MALLVARGEVVFLPTVGDGDDVGGFVDTALEGSFVAAGLRVWVRWVEWRISGLAESAVRAVAPIDGVEEVVQESRICVTCFVDVVVSLEEDGVLRVDDRVGNLKVEIRFGPGCRDRRGSSGSIDTIQGWVRSQWYVWGERQKEFIQVCLAVFVVEVFEDPKLIAGSCFGWVGDIVQSLDALGDNGLKENFQSEVNHTGDETSRRVKKAVKRVTKTLEEDATKIVEASPSFPE